MQETIFKIYIGFVLVSNVYVVYRFWLWLKMEEISLFYGKLMINKINNPIQYWVLKIFVLILWFLMIVGFSSMVWEYTRI